MSKKGKRKKGNTTGSLERRSRPSLPDVSGPSSAPPAPASRAVVASPSASSPVAAGPNASASSSSGSAASPARTPSHGELFVGATSESSAAEELAAAAAPSEVPPRDDNQEESGPRIVAFAPAKTAEGEKSEKAEKAEKPKKESKAPKADAKAERSEKSEKAEKREKAAAPAVELEHESFFEAGEKADKEHRAVARGVLPVDPQHEEDLALKHKMSPAVRERRARFTKYVKWAVGASAILCLAALVRVTVARGQHGTENLGGGSQAAEIAQAAIPTPPPPAPEPTVAQAPPPPAPVADPQPAATTPDPAPAPEPVAASAAATAAAPAADTPTDPAAAKEEKLAARKALERGDLKGAIEAGERSVAFDPTDGDAWLLLGAAYQEKGKGADARRSFTACIKQGKRGAVGECAAMLR